VAFIQFQCTDYRILLSIGTGTVAPFNELEQRSKSEPAKKFWLRLRLQPKNPALATPFLYCQLCDLTLIFCTRSGARKNKRGSGGNNSPPRSTMETVLFGQQQLSVKYGTLRTRLSIACSVYQVPVPRMIKEKNTKRCKISTSDGEFGNMLICFWYRSLPYD